MANKNQFILIAITFLLFCSLRADEINDSRKPEGMITIGIGTGYFGPTSYAGFTFITNNNLFSYRYLKSDEFQFNVEGNYNTPALKLKEYGFLYGRTLRKDILELSLSAGVAIVDGAERGKLIQYREYEQKKISTVGIPFEARFRFEFGIVNLGGAWYGNINRQRNTTGAMLELSFKLFGF